MARLAARCALVLALLPAARGVAAPHPLDPLTFGEHWTLLETLRAAGHLDATTRFSIVQLAEPDKALAWAWESEHAGEAAPRAATAVVRQGAESFEALVDLAGRRLVSWQKIEGAQPNWLGEEIFGIGDLVKSNPDFIAAMKKRGYDDLTFIDCWSVGPGYFGTEEQRGRRIGHAVCYDASGRRNTWARTIPGLTTVIDMTNREVLRVVDEEGPALPEDSADYDPESIGGLRPPSPPISIEQPLGAAFRIEGHIVNWDRWRFHLRADPRVGPVIGIVTWRDGERERPVLYQGSLSELFVPYMDPSFAWYWRNFLDAGEFPAGGLIQPLMRGRDCPDTAAYMEMTLADDSGRPVTVPDAICIYEQLDGEPSWRHGGEAPDSRPKRDLVVRAAAVIGNYDYLLDWTFQQSGSIRIGVGATGIVESRVVGQAKHGGAGPPDDLYGRFVDDHIVAVNHDHYFSFRLDLDVDGPVNRFVVDALVQKELPPENPRRSIWVVDESVARRESEAKMKINLERPKLWRVESMTAKNANGYPTSYQLMPGKNGLTLLSEDDYPRRRAGFIDRHLWVTPYRPAERYAAGDYPTLSTPGQGLPQWTAADRSIDSTDLVLWHTVAMHHLVRAEDWPIMPVMWHTFELRPFDFFDRNPGIDLPMTP